MTKHIQEIKGQRAPQPEAAPSPASSRPRLPFLGGLVSRRNTTATTTPAPATRSQNAARPETKFQRRYFFGIFIYFILGEFFGIAETAIFARLPKQYNPTLGVLPLLGPIQLSAVIFALVLILLLVVMYKLDLMPRKLNQLSSAQANTRGTSVRARTSRQSKTPAPPQRVKHSGPVAGPHDQAYEHVKSTLRQQRRRERRGR